MSGSDPSDGLEDLLAGRRSPDVYRWHSLRAQPQVRDEVEAAGWRWGHLGGWPVTDRRALLTAVGGALDFGDYYGRNLDALWDCLGELTRPTVLVWDHWARLARADDAGFGAVLEVLRERARSPVGDTAPAFAVLLWGEGPSTGAPSLD